MSIGQRLRPMSLLLIGLTSGCAANSFLPQDGPHKMSVENGGRLRAAQLGPGQDLQYALIGISDSAINQLAVGDPVASFGPELVGERAGGGGIGVGDVVAVTIFESGAGGLFIPSEPGSRLSNSVVLPTQQVNAAGNIMVPFAGALHVAGQDPQAVARLIESRLSNRALDPQAVVTVQEHRATAVSINGDVSASTHFSLEPGGERVLGALSRSGGPKYPPYETTVTVQRNGVTSSALLSEILANSDQNIQLASGDAVYVSHTPRYFLALGALGPGQFLGLVNRRQSFDDIKLSLADAIAKVGGLSDDRANAQAVFVYRFEARTTLTALGVATTAVMPATIPTIYTLDLTQPTGYFDAQKFMIRNEDLVFVSNSPSTDLAKFLALILPAAYSSANFRAL